MLLFRSEEHVDRWLKQRGMDEGGLFTPEKLWRLAQSWYGNRMARDWRRRTADEAQALFDDLGLTGDFWRLTHA